jgi:sugar phosphate isomerase/epimerase
VPSNAETPLSFAHLSELGVGPPALIDHAAGAGLASVGIRIRAASPGGIEYPLTDAATLAATRRRIRETGVSVLYIELVTLTRTTKVADCRAMLDTGAELGATRLAVAGDDADFGAVAERLAELCDLARGYGIAVDLEFMPFRAVKSLADGAAILRRADRPNAHLLIDALHFYRSGSRVADLAGIPRAWLGTFQICDAPRAAPSDLVAEARTHRLLPGKGKLALWPLIEALPPDLPMAVELPIAGQYPKLDPAARMALMVQATRAFLGAGRPA